MLRSLEIRNYRNLRHLTIEKLGRVNLLVGKNNTGKTSVLEAVGLLIKKGEAKFIFDLLKQRGENYVSSSRYNAGRPNQVIRSLSALFTDRPLFTDKPIFFSQQNWLTVTATKQLSPDDLPEEQITVRFIRYIDERDQHDGSPTGRIKILRDEPDLEKTYNEDDIEIGLEIKYNKSTVTHSLNSFWRANDRAFFDDSAINSDFISTNNVYRSVNGSLWDSVALTEKEQHVLDSLRIIESDINGITFADNDVSETPERIAIVRLKSSGQKVPLRSMGDGINRILTIVLAMVNCENAYILIDEFENGLHYSVQEKLWEVIFSLSERLNIQVFATTHSSDTIRSFTAVLSKQSNSDEAGKAIRLQLHNDSVRAVDYSPEELETAAEFNIEVR